VVRVGFGARTLHLPGSRQYVEVESGKGADALERVESIGQICVFQVFPAPIFGKIKALVTVISI
jgi:hypothetical protein